MIRELGHERPVLVKATAYRAPSADSIPSNPVMTITKSVGDISPCLLFGFGVNINLIVQVYNWAA
jgi:hypothetical protein